MLKRERDLGRALVGRTFVTLLLLLGGCSSDRVALIVTSTPETNGGRPFYAVFRAVEEATYLTDTYEAIAALIFANPADPSVLAAHVIYPGIEVTVTAARPEALPLGMYFLFTDPGERWKVLKAQPLPSSVGVDLAASDVASID